MLLLAWATLMASAVLAAENSDNGTIICNWNVPRVNVIRDKVYINGGRKYTATTSSKHGVPAKHPDGTYYTFNLSNTFDTKSNFSSLLDMQSGVSPNALPDYYGGAMFANDYEFILYGGKLNELDMKAPPSAQSIVVYQRYAQPGSSGSGVPGINEVLLHDKINRYVVGGAATSAPSENLGFYFSGKHAKGWNSTDNTDTKTPAISRRLIIADLAEGFNADGWKNESIGKDIPGRPGAELVWVPVSEKGMLVVIGGSSDLNYLADFPSDVDENPKKASHFMRTISLYDVDSKKWFQQNTTGTIPPVTAEFCAGLVSNNDKSVHNIYIYGGYNGTDFHANRSDDVYVLTLPRFEWVKLYNGTSELGRAGHRCVVPDPSRMLVMGGVGKSSAKCIPQIFRTFDLNEGKFVDKYDPSTHKDYSMPDKIKQVNGLSGSGNSGTDRIKPAKGWSSKELQKLFETKYPKDIRTWYPYTKDDDSHKEHHLPKWVPPFLGVICGLIGVGLIIAVIWLILRRRRQTREKAKAKELEEAADRQRELMKYPPLDANGYPIQGGYFQAPYQSPPQPVEVSAMPVSELANTAVPIEVAARSPPVAPAELPGTVPGVSAPGPQSESARDNQHDDSTHGEADETRSLGHSNRIIREPETSQVDRRSI